MHTVISNNQTLPPKGLIFYDNEGFYDIEGDFFKIDGEGNGFD